MRELNGVTSIRNVSGFKDILDERRRTSDVLWISRQWNPIPSFAQSSAVVNPLKIRQAVFNSDRVKEVVRQLSADSGVKEEDLYKEVEQQLNEIGHNRQISIVRWIGLFVTKLLKKTCTGLMVNEDSVNKLKAIMGDTPIIFAPSHRSYADFILMAFICFHYSIEIPCVAAGMDFMSMWLMGQMLRDCCAFFMRRSFTEDRLYWTVFSEYVRTLITSGNAPVEFFIEGTRSRSSKSLVPKYGFLSMALQPFFTGQIPDVLIVPINISYDRVLEEKLFAYELLGVPKPKESTSGLIRALHVLNEKYGRIHVDFSSPFSVRRFLLERSIPRPIHFSGPIRQEPLNSQEMKVIRLLSHNIIQSQQQLSILSTFSLVALIFNNNILVNGMPQMALNDVIHEVSWFRSVLETFEAVVDISGDVETAVKESISIHSSLVTLFDNSFLRLKAIHAYDTKLNIEKLRGHALTGDTMAQAVPLLMLQHYVNPTLHFLANPAIVTVLMQELGRNGDISKDELFARYQRVRAILSHEMVFFKAREDKEFEDALRMLDLVNIIEVSSSGQLTLGNHRKLQILLCNVLYPFFSSYLSLGHTLTQLCGETETERKILCEAQRRIEQNLMSSEMLHPAALSLDILSCGLQSFATLGAVQKIKKNGEVLYVAKLNELQPLMEELDRLTVQPGRFSDLDKPKWKQIELNHSIPAKL